MPQRRRMARAIVSATAASTFLALGTPAWASNPVPLNDAHEGSTAAGFETQDCEDERFKGLADDQDGWHFVLPGSRDQSGDFEKLELTFSDGEQTVDVVIPDAGDPYPDALYTTGSGQVKHAYLFTPAGWTLVSGTAHVSGAAEFFNLSHTCPGEPSPTPSPSGSATPSPSSSATPSPSESATPTPSGSATPTPSESTEPSTSVTPSGGTGGGGGLPVTGAAATTMALLGVGLIGGGAALVVLRRRRDNVTFTS